MKKQETRKIVLSGFLIAMDVLLTRILALNTSIMKIGFGFVAIAISAALYGPWWAAVCGALGDLLGSLIFPTGAYFPGFTLTAALTGFFFGLFLKPYSRGNALIAAVVNTVVVSYLGNTAMIAYLSGTEYIKLLTARAVQIIVMLPVQCIILSVILPILLNRINASASNKNTKKTS